MRVSFARLATQTETLPDHASRPGPGSCTAPAAPESTGSPSTRATTGGASSGRAGTAAPPGGRARTSSTGKGGLPRSERPPKRAVVERAIEAFRDVSGLVKLQKGDSLLGKVREALESMGGAGGQGQMSEREVARYLFDDQGLVWYELEQRGILVSARRSCPCHACWLPTCSRWSTANTGTPE